MITIRKRTSIGEDMTSDFEVVLSAPSRINDAFEHFRLADGVKAEVLSMEFAEAAAEFVGILVKQSNIRLQPLKKPGDDFFTDFWLASVGIREIPPVGIAVSGNGLEMAMTATRKDAAKILASKSVFEKAFEVMMAGRFAGFSYEMARVRS